MLSKRKRRIPEVRKCIVRPGQITIMLLPMLLALILTGFNSVWTETESANAFHFELKGALLRIDDFCNSKP
ncbi:hypothetical protein EV356DRAFT_496346 [Viridothelium virens]|uniref:Uncharacterized protein n=1 Tax=Viridothelium virens TaxID=1048519 RepID=A0A6A6GTZ6_VIRVR|nr:hypothetical protein EV356DRAFT_496346 [Viridothelium virens]